MIAVWSFGDGWMDRLKGERRDICDSRVTFRTENFFMILDDQKHDA